LVFSDAYAEMISHIFHPNFLGLLKLVINNAVNCFQKLIKFLLVKTF